MGQSDRDPRKIDQNLYWNLHIQILYMYQHKCVAQLEKLNYGTITTYLRKGFAYRCEIPSEQKQGF